MSDERKDGGPAFPHPGSRTFGGDDYNVYPELGMTLRDWFAGQAMQATLSSETAVAEIMASDMRADRVGLAKSVAGVAYLFADAMIAARVQP